MKLKIGFLEKRKIYTTKYQQKTETKSYWGAERSLEEWLRWRRRREGVWGHCSGLADGECGDPLPVQRVARKKTPSTLHAE